MTILHQNIYTDTGWTAMKVWKGVCGVEMMNPTDFGDPTWPHLTTTMSFTSVIWVKCLNNFWMVCNDIWKTSTSRWVMITLVILLSSTAIKPKHKFTQYISDQSVKYTIYLQTEEPTKTVCILNLILAKHHAYMQVQVYNSCFPTSITFRSPECFQTTHFNPL